MTTICKEVEVEVDIDLEEIIQAIRIDGDAYEVMCRLSINLNNDQALDVAHMLIEYIRNGIL